MWKVKQELAGTRLHGVKVRDLESDSFKLVELSVMPETVLSEVMGRIEDKQQDGDYLVIDGILYVPMEILEGN